MTDQQLYEILRLSFQQPRPPDLVRRVEALKEQLRRAAVEQLDATTTNRFDRYLRPSLN